MSDTQLSAIDRTKSLERKFLPVDQLDPNPLNPNKMSDAEFNLLYDNIERMGVTDPILVRPLPNGRYSIVGGEHRWQVAKLHELQEVPVTIITDPSFDDDMQAFQTVRMNIIRGKMDAQGFMKLYESLNTKYAEDVASELFGFSDEKEFRKLIQTTAKSLPKEMQQQFKEAAKEIKTIDDLALVLNKLFTQYGDTLDYGYMVFDFGGQQHVWLRMAKTTKGQFLNLCDWCKVRNRSVDQVLGVLMQLIATNALSQDALVAAVDKLPEVHVPAEALPVESVQH